MSASLSERLDSVFRDVRADEDADGRLIVHANPASVPSILTFLKDDGYDFLQLVSCVDWIDDGEFEIVYVLSCYDARESDDCARMPVTLKTRVPRSAATLETSIAVYPAAEPYEREMHELFGVGFEGHPRLTRLLLERDYEIPPFRKDFDLRQYVEDLFGNVPSVGEEDEGQ